MLSDDQKRARVTYAKKMLKLYPNFDKKKFANVVTGDETSVHFYEPQGKVRNKICALKNTKRPCIAKRTMSECSEGFVCHFLRNTRASNTDCCAKG